jgi:hypothetical protein
MKIFDYILCLIGEIPATFWGVVIGSFFSVLCVALTNRANDKRLRAQFDHERELKTLDREMTLRKDVYLSAAEAISSGVGAISRFANFDIPNDQIMSGYIEKVPAISKVHVIAKTETILWLTQFTNRLNALYLTLFARRYELQNEQNAIKILDDQVAIFGKERDSIVELMKQYNIDGAIDGRRWKVLQDNFEFQQDRIHKALIRRDELVAALVPKKFQFMQECVEYTSELDAMTIPILLAARTELELPLDEGVYRAVMAEGNVMRQEAIDAFIQKFTSDSNRQAVQETDQPTGSE